MSNPGSLRLTTHSLLCLPVLVSGLCLFQAAVSGIGIHHDVPEGIAFDLASNGSGYPVGPYPDFSPVAAVLLPDRAGTYEVIGSATLIAPQWVLTAAHIVLSGKAGRDFESKLQVRFGPSAKESKLGFEVAEVATLIPVELLRPLLRSGTRYSNQQIVHAEFHDLALLRLDSPVADIVPARFDATGAELLRQLIYIAGYGDAGTGDNPDPGSWIPADRKRAAQNIIDREIRTNPFDATCPGGLVLFDFDSGGDDRNTLNLATKAWTPLFGTGQSSPVPARWEGSPYLGDSGGPAFARLGEDWQLVAVSGYGTGFPPNQRRTSIQYGDILVYTRIAPHAPWIRRVISEPVSPPSKSTLSPLERAAEDSESAPNPVSSSIP